MVKAVSSAGKKTPGPDERGEAAAIIWPQVAGTFAKSAQAAAQVALVCIQLSKIAREQHRKICRRAAINASARTGRGIPADRSLRKPSTAAAASDDQGVAVTGQLCDSAKIRGPFSGEVAWTKIAEDDPI